MKKLSGKVNIWFFLVLLLSGIILFSHTLYVFKTFAYPEWDEHKYLGAAINFLPVLQHPTTHFFQDMLVVQKNYLPASPPLYPLAIDVPLLIFGTTYTYKISLWINVIFYIATIISVYFLAKEFFSKRVSFLASFMFAFYGFPLFYLHFTYTETAATGFTTLALCFLSKTKQFQNTKNVCLFALFLALAFLTRWTTPIFVFGPFLVIVFLAVRNIKKKNTSVLVKNILLFLAFCFIPLILYYIPNQAGFLGYLKAGSQQGASWMPAYLRNPFSAHSFIWYFSIIAQQTILFYLLFLIGLVLSFFYWKKYAFLLFGFIIPYIFFTCLTVFKDDRFIVPLYPMIAIISAIVFSFIEEKKWRIVFFSLFLITIVMGFLNFFGASWGIGPMQFSTTGSIKKSVLPNSILMPMLIGHPRRVWLTPISWPPRTDEGKADIIFSTIALDWKYRKAPHVLITFEMSQVSSALVSIISYEHINALSTYNLDGIKQGDYRTFVVNIQNADYIIIKDGILDKGYPEGKYPTWDMFILFVRIFNKVIQQNPSLLTGAFKNIKEISIPADHSTLTIYKRIRQMNPTEIQQLKDTLLEVVPSDVNSIQGIK